MLSSEALSNEDALALRALAESKLSATLHSAVERVRYITGASGVALALCEGDEDAMVCRASSGLTAPEVGARMYIQSGITAESMRTRQTLRCDQASTDPRVNQESCKSLGIESVMVMPLILGRSVVGMIELFGERPSAFAGRDAKTLHAMAPQVHSALEEAVSAGIRLGRIPWADEVMDHPTPGAERRDTEGRDSEGRNSEGRNNEGRNIESRDNNGLDLDNEALDHREASDTRAPATITFRVPVAFPIDAFKKPDDRQVEEQAVPAFLARLAGEARPASGRSWSQWFRPQW